MGHDIFIPFWTKSNENKSVNKSVNKSDLQPYVFKYKRSSVNKMKMGVVKLAPEMTKEELDEIQEKIRIYRINNFT